MVEYDARQTPIHKISSEDVNYILADSYKVDDDILPTVEKNQFLEVIITHQYIKMYGNIMV